MTRGASMKKVTFYRNHFLTSQEEKSQEVKKPQLQNLTTLSARCGYFLKKLEIPRRNSDSLHHLSSRCRAGDSVALGERLDELAALTEGARGDGGSGWLKKGQWLWQPIRQT